MYKEVILYLRFQALETCKIYDVNVFLKTYDIGGKFMSSLLS